MEPALTSAENPMFSIKLWSRIAVSKAPLWLRSATLPGRAIAPAKVALRPVGGFMTPRQLGPTILILPRLASSRTWRSSFAPSDPVSLKPAEIIMAPSTPASTHSRIISGTAGAGATMSARSTLAGTSETEGYAFMPSTLGLCEFTGKTVPPNGLLTRFHMIVRPTLPGRSDAPITATVSGRSRSEERRVGKECRSRCDWSSDVCSSDLDRPAKRAADEVPHDRTPHATRTLGRPDHSHRLGTV